MSSNIQVGVYLEESGHLAVFAPTSQALSQTSMEDLLAQQGITSNYLVLSSADLPNADRDFRDAWEIDSASVVVNLEKAKEITKARLREEREPLLASLDVDYMRALELGSDTTEIVNEKNRLRDITDIPDTAQSLDELRQISVQPE